MKEYGKYILWSFLWGILAFAHIIAKHAEIELIGEGVISQSVGQIALESSKNIMPEMLVEWLIGLMFHVMFIILFGTYIYRHFMVASIYVFSRCQNRTKWLLREIAGLFLFAFACYTAYVAGRTAVNMLAGRTFDKSFFFIVWMEISLNVLFLTVFSFLANLIAIYGGSRLGSCISCGLLICFVMAFALVGENGLRGIKLLLFRLNPTLYLILGWYKSDNVLLKDYLNSDGMALYYWQGIVYYLVLLLLLVAIAIYLIKNKDILPNKEQVL